MSTTAYPRDACKDERCKPGKFKRAEFERFAAEVLRDLQIDVTEDGKTERKDVHWSEGAILVLKKHAEERARESLREAVIKYYAENSGRRQPPLRVKEDIAEDVVEAQNTQGNLGAYIALRRTWSKPHQHKSDDQVSDSLR